MTLDIKIQKKKLGGYYMIVNGIEDLSARVTVSEQTGHTSAYIKKTIIKEILFDYSIKEISQFLSDFLFFHSSLPEWQAAIYIRVNCLRKESSLVEIFLTINFHQWKKSYSINDLRSAFTQVIDELDDVGIVNEDIAIPSNKSESRMRNIMVGVRFYAKEEDLKLSSIIEDVLKQYELILHEVQFKLARIQKGIWFSVPREMTVALKQYLIYFPEYIEIAKGKKITFEVKTTDDGIYIETGTDDNLQELNSYFNEYLGYIKANIQELNPRFEVAISETQKELFVLNLKQQVSHFKQQIEFKNFEIKVLEREVDRYYNLLMLQNNKPVPPVNINTIAIAENKVDVNIVFKQELPRLQSDILQLKSALNEHVPEAIKKEIDVIDAELFDADLNIEKSKKPLKRIKRLFDQLTDENSTFNKNIQQSKKLKENLQKLGKTYNKIAQWIGMPVVPDIFLNI